MSQATKPQLRRHYRNLRSAALAQAQGLILAAARRELPDLVPPGQRLGIYWPLAGEADLRPLASLGLGLALPAVWGEAKQAAQLLYRPWLPGDLLAPDHCGIPAPQPPAQPQLAAGGLPPSGLPPSALALLLVPALAFDRHSGIRLGSGGGWYDRLRADPAWRAVPALAVLPAACVVEALASDPWDLPFDGWLDEGGIQPIAHSNIAVL